jgi:hypothetical protein
MQTEISYSKKTLILPNGSPSQGATAVRKIPPMRMARGLEGIDVDLKLPIKIFDELTESVIESTGMLDLASGEIRGVKYEDYDSEDLGIPAEDDTYEFTSGLLTNGVKDVEFRVDVDVTTGNYSVTPSELLELKGRAAKLFTAAPTDAAPTIAPRKSR